MERRDFIKAGALAASITALPVSAKPNQSATDAKDKWGSLLPFRTLGRTGEKVTMLGVGGYHVGWTHDKDAAEIIETAMESGVRFFDTAESYQSGESEKRYGRYLVPKYRKECFIMTKTQARDAETARKDLDESLKRLNTDYIDLWQIHSISNPEDVDNRLKNGVLDVMLKAKSEGKVRYIGFTGHSNPEAHLRMLEQTADSDPFDTCQMPVNILDPQYHSFILQVMPKLEQKNIAPLAMKTLADGRFFALKKLKDRTLWQTENPVIPDHLSIRDALHFAWSYPVSVLITGAENASLLREKVDFARTYVGMSDAQRVALLDRLSDYSNHSVEYFKQPVVQG